MREGQHWSVRCTVGTDSGKLDALADASELRPTIGIDLYLTLFLKNIPKNYCSMSEQHYFENRKFSYTIRSTVLYITLCI